MWQYRVTTLPACCTSTYQPQPLSVRLPSTSQLPAETLQTTRITVPAAAARIGVYRAAPRSTPSCDGRSLVRKPLTSPAPTGSCHAPATGGATAGAGAGAEQAGILKVPRFTYASETYELLAR